MHEIVDGHTSQRLRIAARTSDADGCLRGVSGDRILASFVRAADQSEDSRYVVISRCRRLKVKVVQSGES
jgi:hypothetical protein